ncbi:MAG: hypothetical protein ACWGSQ_18155, partial [Longimicrobiales bacterium]
HDAARNKVYGAFRRAAGGVSSVTDLDGRALVTELVDALNRNLEEVRDLNYGRLEAAYRARCDELGVMPVEPGSTLEAGRYEGIIPVRAHAYYTPEYQEASGRLRALLPPGIRLPRLASTEIEWFVDGERSVGEIWRLVRAEYGNVTTSSHEWKFAYVVTPDSPDIALEDVAAYLQAMEEAGMVVTRRR